MPVTAKFSEMFYKKFGHQLTDELVNYLNQIDTSYRSELRELNEFNFARFDSKLEQRIAELRSDIERGLVGLDSKCERKIGEFDAKLDSKIDQRTAELRGEMVAGFASCKSDLIKWMFVFWAGTTVTVVGTMIALVKL